MIYFDLTEPAQDAGVLPVAVPSFVDPVPTPPPQPK